MTDGQWPPHVDEEMLNKIVSVQSRSVARMFRDYVTLEDVSQEIFLHIWANRNYVEEYFNRDTPEERKRGLNACRRMAWKAGEKYARKEKARQLGYSIEDEYFYPREQIRELVRVWYYHEFTGQEVPEERPRGKSMKPLNQGNELPAMVSDFGVAFESLDVNDRLILIKLYAEGLRSVDAAHKMEMTAAQIDSRALHVIKKLQRRLGGASPYAKD